MRICPKCRLITADGSTCAECGWNPARGSIVDALPNGTYAGRLQALMVFTAVMFIASTVVAFSVTRGDSVGPALAGGLLGAGLIADAFLVRLIYQAAELYEEAQKWTVGALLTFPFGTLVFAWLLVKRLRQEKPVAPQA
jgi:hypothetical protein